MSAKHLEGADLSSMFGIDMVDPAPVADAAIAQVVCSKCSGRGKFIGYTGRVIGPCFTCEGTGLARGAGVALAADGCVKCAGSGEWRPSRPCFACNGTGKIQEAALVDVSAISAAFSAARANGIKSPRLRLDSFVFSRAPDAGRNAGSIYVKRDGEYLGRVTAGEFHRAFACDDATKARVIEVASDPHNAAKAYGAKFGICSCCGRELSNAESVALGIGPICRDKFGW